VKIQRALLSVSDKTGLLPFAQILAAQGVELISTGGTRQTIADAGVPVKDVSEITDFPEMLDGRVKTLHPAVHAGILAKRDKAEHLKTLEEHRLPVFDLIVCNLYAFEETVAKPGCTVAQAIDNIDIGGPTMIRAAAKNHNGVAVLTSAEQYGPFIEEISKNGGKVSLPTRQRLAADAFSIIADYDLAIARYHHLATLADGQDRRAMPSVGGGDVTHRKGRYRHERLEIQGSDMRPAWRQAAPRRISPPEANC